MSYLFYIDEKNICLLRPECYKLSPELSTLDEKDILFVAMAFDYHSLYRQFPEHERIRKAMFHVYDKYDPKILEKQSMALAIEAYKALQYDPKIELAHRYQKKIDRLLDILDADDNASSIQKNTMAIDILRKNIMGLENEVADSITSKGQVKGNQGLSWLEDQLSSNKKQYLALKNK